MNRKINADPIKTFSDVNEADAFAAALRSGELDGWTYVVRSDSPAGEFAVAAHDETGAFVDYWREPLPPSKRERAISPALAEEIRIAAVQARNALEPLVRDENGKRKCLTGCGRTRDYHARHSLNCTRADAAYLQVKLALAKAKVECIRQLRGEETR